jgi:hypothetical protein
MRFWVAATGLGLFVYLIGLAAQFPAARLAPYLAEQGVVLESPRGSIWAGSAARMRLGGAEIPAPSWELSAAALVIGQVRVRLTTGWGEARLRAGLGGDLELRDIDLVVPLQDIPVAGALQVGGDVRADVPGIEIVDGLPRRAQGSVQWRNATLGAEGMALGGFGLELTTVNDKIIGRISDQGGPVEANGAVVLGPDGRYRLDLQLTARPGAEKVIENGLRLLGTAEPDGGVRLSREGRFQDLLR